MSEHDYSLGQRAAWLRLLRLALSELAAYTDLPQTVKLARLAVEREETIAALRSLCERRGDNEWAEHDSLADVVEKHLARHLR